MSDRITSFVSGLGLSSMPGQSMTEEQRMAWYKKLGIEPPPAKASPLRRAAQWVQERLTPAMDTSAAPAAAPAASTGDVGLMERLKAGNIDDYGSEAYNRWGQGKTDGDASELAREANRTSPELFTKEMWENAPEQAQSNPDWDGLPGDEYAMKMGA